MILIKKKIIAQGKEIIFDCYLGSNYSVTLINKEQKILSLQDMLQSYIVDEQQQKLVTVPDGKEQMTQIKNLLGDIWLDEAYHIPSTYKQRSYHIANNFILTPAKLTGEVAVCVDDRLAPTVSHIQNIYENKRQFFELSLKENETLSYIQTAIELNGQTVVTKMEILSIEEAIMPSTFQDFLKYTIIEKAA